MKIIIINDITTEKVAAAIDAAALGTAEEKAHAATLSEPVISTSHFPIGEWIHLDDKWVSDNATTLAKYPDLKEAHIVLEDKLKEAIDERSLQYFAQGLVEANKVYGEKDYPLPKIATTVHEYVPYVEKEP
jgi:hypothetical protein